eukprot:8622937-Lingulodinium_polyedra.AAC.1
MCIRDRSGAVQTIGGRANALDANFPIEMLLATLTRPVYVPARPSRLVSFLLACVTAKLPLWKPAFGPRELQIGHVACKNCS